MGPADYHRMGNWILFDICREILFGHYFWIYFRGEEENIVRLKTAEADDRAEGLPAGTIESNEIEP